MAIFQVDLDYGLADIRISTFWILLELRMREVVVTIRTARRAKLQSYRHHQQTNTQLLAGRMASLSPGVRLLLNSFLITQEQTAYLDWDM